MIDQEECDGGYICDGCNGCPPENMEEEEDEPDDG